MTKNIIVREKNSIWQIMVVTKLRNLELHVATRTRNIHTPVVMPYGM